MKLEEQYEKLKEEESQKAELVSSLEEELRNEKQKYESEMDEFNQDLYTKNQKIKELEDEKKAVKFKEMSCFSKEKIGESSYHL